MNNPEEIYLTRRLDCPNGHGQMLGLTMRPTMSNPEGQKFPTWWCPDCDTLATVGVSGNQISVEMIWTEKSEGKDDGVSICQQ